MKDKPLISEGIDAFYSEISDEDRYTKGLGPLELERNKLFFKSCIAAPGSIIIDVGGGTGVYAEWLAGLGHHVHLVDPVRKHVRKALRKAAASKHSFSCSLGEARDLDFPDNFADMVILHGPLYHLQSRKERLKAIKEAKRVCKKNGIIVGIAINYASYTLAGLVHGLIHDPGFLDMCKGHLATGIHHPPSNDKQRFLAEAYFHRPDELLAEFESLQLRDLELKAVEGLTWLDKHYFRTNADPVRKKAMTELLRLTENDLSLISLSPHMVISGRK